MAASRSTSSSAEAPLREQPDRHTEPSRRQALLSPATIGVHVFAAAVTVVCVLAGNWQLDAYRSEQATESADRSGAAPVPVADLLDVDEALSVQAVGRRVVAQGTYAPAGEQLLVADRKLEGRPGWWVLSPLLVADDTALLVVRGWTDEQALPPLPAGQVSVTAAVQPGEDASTEDRVVPTDGMRVVDVVRLPSLVNELPYRIYPAYALLTAQQPPADDGLAPVSAPEPEPSSRTGLRSLAYALQWWAFGAFALFMWWRIVTDRLRGDEAPPVA